MHDKGDKVKKVLSRTGICVLTSLLLTIVILFGCVATINYGPSEAARGLFVNTVLETSAAKFLATWFFSDEDLQKIISKNTINEDNGFTDSSMIRTDIPKTYSAIISGGIVQGGNGQIISPPSENTQQGAQQNNGVEVFEVKGDTYKGKMMVVRDPSRVFVGVSGEFGEGFSGKTVYSIAKEYNAVAGINGGRFADEGGLGNGGTPVGIVMSQGQLLWGEPGVKYNIIGFTNDNVFVVGKMTTEEAINAGVRDAVSFGPTLIMNGKASEMSGSAGGINPRTAIGQRADGAVLLLVIDGRQPSSLGANYGDIIEVMLQYGAVNAANLDGGNSTCMYYNGQIINSVAYDMRDLPTGFFVK